MPNLLSLLLVVPSETKERVKFGVCYNKWWFSSCIFRP